MFRGLLYVKHIDDQRRLFCLLCSNDVGGINDYMSNDEALNHLKDLKDFCSVLHKFYKSTMTLFATQGCVTAIEYEWREK